MKKAIKTKSQNPATMGIQKLNRRSEKMKKAIGTIAGLGMAIMVGSTALAQDINLRAIGIVSTHKHHTALERSFYDTLAEKTGLSIAVNFNPLDVVGVNMQDTLRLVRSGTFDIVETTIGSAARDDTFLEGLDLIGVSPDIDTLQGTVEAYREEFDARLASKFNTRVMTLWPFGPQMFYCKGDVKGLADLKGLKVRSYTSTMSALVEHLGASPVTLQFAEVYPALQRGVADCAITSATSGNSGNWPEVTDTLLTIGISWSVQGHFMNLDSWNKLTPDQQAKLDKAFDKLQSEYWDMARNLTSEAIGCNTGDESCKEYTKYNMKRVDPSPADIELVNSAVLSKILPTWAENCNANFAECSAKWNATVGNYRGLTIK